MQACARAPPLAAAAAGPGSGSGLGLGLGLGLGSGSLPGLVLFESGLRVWIASIPLRYPNRTRSAMWIRTDPPTDLLQDCWNANSCDCWVRQLSLIHI